MLILTLNSPEFPNKPVKEPELELEAILELAAPAALDAILELAAPAVLEDVLGPEAPAETAMGRLENLDPEVLPDPATVVLLDPELRVDPATAEDTVWEMRG